MENKKLTAVEWLIDRIYDVDLTEEMFEKIKEQALELEKEQIDNAYIQGFAECDATGMMDVDKYYQNTYGQK